MIKPIARRLIEAFVARHGYELRETGEPPRGFAKLIELTRMRGFEPRTVFDVGVGHGTPWLYEGFPDARHVLFEPLDTFHAELETLACLIGGELHCVALSDRSGSTAFQRNVDFPTSSSMYEMDSRFARFAVTAQAEHRFSTQQVRTECLDALNCHEPPYALKLDIEGAELQALRGARRTLQQTELLIMEISVMRRQVGEPTFAETLSAVEDMGFDLFDIPELAQTRNNGPLLYLDAAFVRRDGMLGPHDN